VVASHFVDVAQALLVQAWPLGQATQAPPPLPQRLTVLPGTHWVPEQQPVEQFAGPQVVVSGLQTPPVHCWPVGQAMHVAPPRPHVALVLATHLPAWQQPWQLVGPHGAGVPLSSLHPAAVRTTHAHSTRAMSRMAPFSLE
jgi:hypothetical protein